MIKRQNMKNNWKIKLKWITLQKKNRNKRKDKSTANNEHKKHGSKSLFISISFSLFFFFIQCTGVINMLIAAFRTAQKWGYLIKMCCDSQLQIECLAHLSFPCFSQYICIVSMLCEMHKNNVCVFVFMWCLCFPLFFLGYDWKAVVSVDLSHRACKVTAALLYMMMCVRPHQ